MDKVKMLSIDAGLTSGVLNYQFRRQTEEGFNLDYSKSKSLGINLIHNSTEDEDQVFSYTVGIGGELKTFGLISNTNLLYNDSATFVSKENNFNYSKNKLTIAYLQAPVLLKVNKEIKNRFYQFSFGVIGGLKISSKYKRKYRIDDNKYSVKSNGHYNINPFKLDGTIRLGRNNIGAFFNYNLLSLFEKNKHEKLNTFAVGITYNGF